MLSDEKKLKEVLNEAIDKLTTENVTVEVLIDLIGRQGMLMLCVLLTLPFMVPVSIPGISTVFGLLIILIGIGILIEKRPWLPKRLIQKSFPADKLKSALKKGIIWVEKIEKISRPRLMVLTDGAIMHRVNGFMLILAATLLIAPFGFIPFSNTLPGLAILFIAIGMLQRDGYCISIGYIAILITIVYFAFLIFGGAVIIQKLPEIFKKLK